MSSGIDERATTRKEGETDPRTDEEWNGQEEELEGEGGERSEGGVMVDRRRRGRRRAMCIVKTGPGGRATDCLDDILTRSVG